MKMTLSEERGKILADGRAMGITMPVRLADGRTIELLKPEYRVKNKEGKTVEDTLAEAGYNEFSCYAYKMYLRWKILKLQENAQSEDEKRQKAAEQEFQKQQEYKRKLTEMGIPERYQWANFLAIEDSDNKPTGSVWNAAFIEVAVFLTQMNEKIRNGRGLILYGQRDMWKSNLAAASLIAVTEEGYSGYWISAARLFNELRAMGKDGGTFLENRLRYSDLLVIDNIGIEEQKDWVLSKVNSILLARYDERRSTIITTNLKPKELKQLYPENTIDKLCEICQMIGFYGEQKRMVA